MRGPPDECQSIGPPGNRFDQVGERIQELDAGSEAVTSEKGNLCLLGHPPSLWKVCAAVKLRIDDAVKRIESDFMLTDWLKVNWHSQKKDIQVPSIYILLLSAGTIDRYITPRSSTDRIRTSLEHQAAYACVAPHDDKRGKLISQGIISRGTNTCEGIATWHLLGLQKLS